MHPTTKHKLIALKVLIAGSILLLAMGSTYLARGWIRSSLIPAYAETFYKPQVQQTFNSDFTPVNQQLAPYGLTFSKLLQDDCWSGASAMYEGFSETVPCIKDWQSNLLTPSSNYIAQWQSTSPQLEQYLLSHGWHKEYFAGQPIATLFSVPNYRGTIQVNYSKIGGGVVCNLSISFNPSDGEASSYNGQMYAGESCEKDLVLFGGASG